PGTGVISSPDLVKRPEVAPPALRDAIYSAALTRATPLISPAAWVITRYEDDRASAAMTAATAKSGQPVPLANMLEAASMTARLPMASLRVHSQTERRLLSPLR